jgi:hypothetical protein
VLLCGLARLRLGDWTVRDARGATAQPADVEAIAAEAATALRLLGADPA